MLRKVLVSLAVAGAMMVAVHQAAADDWVRGYVRSNGTYVQPYYRNHADGNFYNNWSTRPNVNPYTGQMGTRQTPSYGGYSSPSYRNYTPNRSFSAGVWRW